MKLIKNSILILFIMTTLSAAAQQALFGGQDIKSPEIKADNSVVFRLFAPNADTVRITGDFLPTEKMKTQWGEFDAPGKALLKKGRKRRLEFYFCCSETGTLFLFFHY